MSSLDRAKLPFRNNCEGYFLDINGNILAQDTDKGYVLFPGGGVDDGEEAALAIERETLEETGARVGHIQYLGSVRYIWPADWPKTEKQKLRYAQFQGDEMHFFTGKIKLFDRLGNEEDAWRGKKLMPLTSAIVLAEQKQPFRGPLKPYYEAQLRFLKELRKSQA